MYRIIFRFSLLFILIFSAYGANHEVHANSIVQMEDGILHDNRTLVPLRAIFEELEATVHWDQPTRTVTATRGNDEITLQIDSTITKVNGKNVVIDVPATLFNDRTYVPLRFVSESLGATVHWDSTRLIASIDSNGKKLQVNVSKIISNNSGNSVIYRNPDMGIRFTLSEKLANSIEIKETSHWGRGRLLHSMNIDYKDPRSSSNQLILQIGIFTTKEWYEENWQFIMTRALAEKDGWVYGLGIPSDLYFEPALEILSQFLDEVESTYILY